jgi:hypothetical protein
MQTICKLWYPLTWTNPCPIVYPHYVYIMSYYQLHARCGPQTIAKLTHIAWLMFRLIRGINELVNEVCNPTQLFTIGFICI